MVMRHFVLELIEVNMALGIVQIKNPAWGEYHIETNTDDGDDATFAVMNGKGKQVNVEWATIEGASACAELLAAGCLKE